MRGFSYSVVGGKVHKFHLQLDYVQSSLKYKDLAIGDEGAVKEIKGDQYLGVLQIRA